MQMTEDQLSIIASEIKIYNSPIAAMRKRIYSKGELIKI